MDVVLGKGNGNNSVWLGHDKRGEGVYLDFSYPIFVVLVGRKRSFKSSCLRVIAEGLLDNGNGFSRGFLPKSLIFDPIGNLRFDRSNHEAKGIPPLAYDNIKTLNPTDGSLKIPFSSLKGDDILALLGIGERAILQRRAVRIVMGELGEEMTKKEFVQRAREYAFELPEVSLEGFEVKLDDLEKDRSIVDDAKNPLEFLKDYRGLRIDLGDLLPSDKAKADFICGYFVKQLIDARRRAREEEIKYEIGEPAEPVLEPVCVIVDELNRVNPRPFFDLVRISGNLGVSVMLASQAIRDFGNPIIGERDVTFCGKLASRDEVRKASALVPTSACLDPAGEIPNLRERSCVAWNEDDGIFCTLRLRDPATLHYGRDESVERFKGLYERRNVDSGITSPDS